MNKQNRIGAELSAFLPHIILVYSIMMLTFSVINYINPSMEFLDAPISRRFELLYVLFILAELVICMLQNRMRKFAVCLVFVTAAFAVPVIVALAQNSREPLLTMYFIVAALIESLVMIVFSVMDIRRRRKAALAANAE